MNWVRATCGIALTFIGVHHAFNGVMDAIEPKAVSLFWRNQERYKQRKRAAL